MITNVDETTVHKSNIWQHFLMRTWIESWCSELRKFNHFLVANSSTLIYNKWAMCLYFTMYFCHLLKWVFFVEGGGVSFFGLWIVFTWVSSFFLFDCKTWCNVYLIFVSFSFTLPLSTLFDGYMYVSCRLFVLDCFSCYFFWGGGVGWE